MSLASPSGIVGLVRASLLAIPPLLFACGPGPCGSGWLRDDDGNCRAQQTVIPADDTGGGDSGAGSGDDGDPFDWAAHFAVGDPIVERWTASESGSGLDLLEWVDAVVLTAELGMVTGEGGWATVDLQTGELLTLAEMDRGYVVDADADHAVVGERIYGLTVLDLSDPAVPTVRAEHQPYEGYHEDVALDGELVLVGYHDDGGLLLDLDLNELATIPAADAFAVGLSGDRAVLTDGDELGLWDVSDPTAPVALDAVEMTASGRDIAFDGDTVAVGLGGRGVGVYAVEDDALVHRGDLPVAGSAFSVSLDGDYLWIGAWVTLAGAWVGVGDVGILGHAAATESAMGLGAGHGMALVADWQHHTAFDLVEGVAGAELVIQEKVYFGEGSTDGVALRVENHGVFDLDFVPGTPSDGWSWDTEDLSLGTGEGATLVLRPDGTSTGGSLPYTSTDPDEEAGDVELLAATQSVGSKHAAFSLESFTWPDDSKEIRSFDPDSHEGVLFLAYFSLY